MANPPNDTEILVSTAICHGVIHIREETSILLCTSYTMACPPVRGDNPRALARRLSYIQVDKHGITT